MVRVLRIAGIAALMYRTEIEKFMAYGWKPPRRMREGLRSEDPTP